MSLVTSIATPDAKQKVHAKGKLTARERIYALLDDDSFVELDALASPRYFMPQCRSMIFLYNPFGEYLIRRLLTKMEIALLEKDSSIWVVYINPVWGNIFDTSPELSRIYAESVPYDPRKIGFGPDSSDVVIIWQDAKSASVNASKGADRGIVVTGSGRRAELAD